MHVPLMLGGSIQANNGKIKQKSVTITIFSHSLACQLHQLLQSSNENEGKSPKCKKNLN